MFQEKVSFGQLRDVVDGATSNFADVPVTKDEIVPSAKRIVDARKDEKGRVYATGKRKAAIARVRIKPGKGVVMVNGKPCGEYFRRMVLRSLAVQSLQHADCLGQYDVWSRVHGGGLSGQASALCHGIGKALQLHSPELRGILKKGGFLRRDSRVVERKKPGRRKARRGNQFSKR